MGWAVLTGDTNPFGHMGGAGMHICLKANNVCSCKAHCVCCLFSRWRQYIYMHGKASRILELVMCSTKNHVETSEIVSKQEG